MPIPNSPNPQGMKIAGELASLLVWAISYSLKICVRQLPYLPYRWLRPCNRPNNVSVINYFILFTNYFTLFTNYFTLFTNYFILFSNYHILLWLIYCWGASKLIQIFLPDMCALWTKQSVSLKKKEKKSFKSSFSLPFLSSPFSNKGFICF